MDPKSWEWNGLGVTAVTRLHAEKHAYPSTWGITRQRLNRIGNQEALFTRLLLALASKPISSKTRANILHRPLLLREGWAPERGCRRCGTLYRRWQNALCV